MLQLHERVGDFEIIRLLGKGGMGEVYEARQSNPDRRVALKVLAPWLASDDESLRRFMQEFNVPANLDHPGIVRIIMGGKDKENGVAYYTMQLVRGISLSEMIRKVNEAPNSDAPTRSVEGGNTPSAIGPMETDDHPPADTGRAPEADASPPVLKAYRHDRFMTVARIGAQAARALGFAHQKGFLHRDIKPSNLMVDFLNYVYLVDFGLTRGLEQHSADSTLPGTLIGTPWYMSPEQAESKPLDARSDVYSLGVTLFELATQGSGPFTASRDNKHSVLAEVRAGRTLPLKMLAPGIPPVLEQIILRAIHLKPHKRYANAADMARDLEAFCGHSAEMPLHPVRKLAPAGRTRRWAAVLAGLLLGAAAISLVALAPWRGRPDENIEEPAPKLDGSQALPEALAEKKNVNVEVNLLNTDLLPRWSEQLAGGGRHQPIKLPGFLSLQPDSYLALADPDRRNFEFTVEFGGLADGQSGMFFGWRRRAKESSQPVRFFMIQWQREEIANEKHSIGIKMGTGRFIKGNAARLETFTEWMRPLPKGKDKVEPIVWDRTHGWPYVKVKVFGEDVTVSMPNRQPISFSLAELKAANQEAYQDLSTAGAVGIWCKSGSSMFRKATLTPLP